ncbi:FKBP-type peptidyl-prolyl cis-trans isomerase [Subtercola lobariae]|uniref:peptidylprolyl isomerase n=1 Tax=Subtercola lobariae TaxID=1588641 RepID=A0A917EX45_9MICO|nr:FKBP-type peptidyl-prolyl cis-trans isomerase [Subtercola lobariae]GGF27538.1 peptidylprolyl isomerase [Subtercola lobariae]
MRKIALFAAAAAVALALAGCSSSGSSATPTAAGCTLTAPGTNSAAVTVTGDLDALPTTTFTAPMTATTTERSVVTTGSGEQVTDGSVATVDFTLYNATSGAQLFTTTDAEVGPQQVTVDSAQFLPGLVKAVDCATVGSRIVAVVPPADAWGTDGNSTLGVAATDTVVFVIDVKSVAAATASPTPSATLDPNMPLKATGAAQPAPAGFPTVTLADDGTPTVTIPSTPAPTTLQIGVLKQGDGATVADGDSVTVQYQGVIWSTGKVFDQSWGQSPATFTTGQVIKGFSAALVGYAVGSQIIAVIPPDQGYGAAGNSTAGISGTDDLVFVIDILATAAA